MVDPLTAISVGSSVLGSVGGLFGKKKKAKTVDQARPYFRPVNETIGEMDKLRDYLAGGTSYTERPMRAMTQDEMTDPIFKMNAVQDIKNYFDDKKVQQNTAPVDPYGGADLARIGRDYVNAYGNSGEVNPTYWQNLNKTANFDYEAIAKMLLDTQNDSSKFRDTNARLVQMGLGYMPKALPKGVKMPTSGIPGYN